MSKTLVMSFLTSGGKKTSISFKNVKDNVEEELVSTAMDTIIEKNIFMTTSGELKSKESAQLVEVITEDIMV